MLISDVRPVVYDEVADVPAAILTTILSREFDLDSRLQISNIMCSGSVYAEFSLYMKDKKIDVKRSCPSRTVDFVFPKSLYCDNGDVLTVKVIHYRSDQLPKFECGIFGSN